MFDLAKLSAPPGSSEMLRALEATVVVRDDVVPWRRRSPTMRGPCPARFASFRMQVEHSVLVDASAGRIFRIYEDVAGWPAWDPDTQRASIEGPFAVGTRGSLTPPKGHTVPMLLTKVQPDACFTVESRIPLFRMVFEHELLPEGAATRVVHRVTFSGLLAAVLGRMLVKRLNQGLPVTLAKLKRRAEDGA